MKKVLSLVLVAILVLGMTVTGFAAAKVKVTDFAAEKDLGPDITGHDVVPQKGDKQTLTINLKPEMFEIKEGDKTLAVGESNYPTKITEKIWRDSKMSVRMAVSSGSKAIDSYKFDDGNIKIEFVDEFVSTSDLDFEFKVYLVIDGKRKNEEALEVSGTIENHTITVYAEDDYVDLSDGAVAEADDFIKNIEVDLGEGVSIHTKMFKGKKYYGTATSDVEAADDEILSKYPDIENVITLKTIGLNATGNIVAFDGDMSGYYVYDKDLNYLGEAKEMLPYSTKYYLSSKKLDIVAEEEPAEEGEEEEIPEGTENPGSGGDDAPVNVNDNPGTGR